MIKIKILEHAKHRNETTFRPYVMHRNYFSDIGIEFVAGDTYDIAWVGQASIVDKKKSLQESIDMGLEFCQNIGGDFMIFDGQDSHSLLGVYEVFKRMRDSVGGACMMLMKNTLLKDFDMYKQSYVNGRSYWGECGNYSITDIDDYKDGIKLSGTNWLSTLSYKFVQMDYFNKKHDVCGLFGYPLTEGVEHGLDHYEYYNAHRKPCVEVLSRLSERLDVPRIVDGVRIPTNEYYKIMAESKIVVAPFGFGEIAPRDAHTMAFGSVLIKPSMDHLRTEPWLYDDGETYIACSHDFSDLEEKIDYVLSNYSDVRERLYTNSLERYLSRYGDPHVLPTYIHKLFLETLNTVTHE